MKTIQTIVIEVHQGCVTGAYVTGRPQTWPRVFAVALDGAEHGESTKAEELEVTKLPGGFNLMIKPEKRYLFVFRPNKRQQKDSGRKSLANGEIAERAASAVCTYAGVCNPEDYNISDLIADLGHASDREGHDFRELLRVAITHWEAER